MNQPGKTYSTESGTFSSKVVTFNLMVKGKVGEIINHNFLIARSLIASVEDQNRLASNLHLGFPGGASGKEPPANAGDIRNMGLIPWLGKSPGGGCGNPLQYCCSP